MILDDSTDDTSQLVDAIQKEYTQKHFVIKVQRRLNRQGYKAGALQLALENTSAEFLAIFDADYTPPDDFLLRSIPYLLQDDKLAIVQSRWTHLNRSFNRITSAIAIGIESTPSNKREVCFQFSKFQWQVKARAHWSKRWVAIRYLAGDLDSVTASS
jgi:cellulose synthase/poly-beta-1,6-N-acetylglucosamine synthase-like glycosyltransferase